MEIAETNNNGNKDLLTEFWNLIESSKINSVRKIPPKLSQINGIQEKLYKVWNISNLEITRTNRELESTKSVNSHKSFFANKIKVGPHIWRGFLSENQIGLKLGDSSGISTSFVLIVDKPELIHPNRVLLLGPDISEIIHRESIHKSIMNSINKAEKHDYPIVKNFAWVVLISITPDHIKELRTLSKLRSTLYFHDELEGIMRGASIRIHSFSISKDLLKKNISFKDIAIAFNEYILKLNKRFGFVTGLEHIFIVENKELINELIKYGNKLKRNHVLKYKKEYPKYQKLRNDCDFLWDCVSCNYKSICDTIRKMVDETRRLK